MLIITLFAMIVAAACLRIAVYQTENEGIDPTKWIVEISLLLYSIGAITPIARAAYCDVHITNKRVPNIINTFLIQPIPWIFFFKLTFSDLRSVIALFLAGFLMIFFTFLFKDKRDKDHRKLSFGFKDIREEYGWILCSRILVAFFLSNSIWNMLQYFFEEKAPHQVTSDYFSIGQGIAFLAGAAIARFIDIDKKKMLGLVFVLIATFVTIQLIEGETVGDQRLVLRPIFIAFTFFGGIGLPLIYAFFGRKAALHEQGMLYGLLESIQTGTEWTGSYSLSIHNLADHPAAIARIAVIVSFISFLLTVSLIRSKWRRKGALHE